MVETHQNFLPKVVWWLAHLGHACNPSNQEPEGEGLNFQNQSGIQRPGNVLRFCHWKGQQDTYYKRESFIIHCMASTWDIFTIFYWPPVFIEGWNKIICRFITPVKTQIEKKMLCVCGGALLCTCLFVWVLRMLETLVHLWEYKPEVNISCPPLLNFWDRIFHWSWGSVVQGGPATEL